jgi:mannose-6-phosphate isomerase
LRKTEKMEFIVENAARVEKPWGYELVYARNELYVGKVLFVKKGQRLSLQYHREKDETIYIFQGKIDLQVGEKEGELAAIIMEEGDAMRLKPNTLHRMKALVDTFILEASTPQIHDVVRLEDDYGRV